MQHLNTYFIVTTEGGCYWDLVIRGQDCCYKHPTNRTAPITKNHLDQMSIVLRLGVSDIKGMMFSKLTKVQPSGQVPTGMQCPRSETVFEFTHRALQASSNSGTKSTVWYFHPAPSLRPFPPSPHPSISLSFSLSPSFSLCLPTLTEISRNRQESTPIQEGGATSYTTASSSCFPLCPVKVGTDLRSVKRAEKMIQHTPSVSSASSFTLPCVGKSPSAGPTLLAVPAGED